MQQSHFFKATIACFYDIVYFLAQLKNSKKHLPLFWSLEIRSCRDEVSIEKRLTKTSNKVFCNAENLQDFSKKAIKMNIKNNRKTFEGKKIKDLKTFFHKKINLNKSFPISERNLLKSSKRLLK